MVREVLAGLACAAALAESAVAQDASPLRAERNAYSEWLSTAAASPLAAVAMHRISGTVTLGPDTSDIPLPGFGPAVVEARGGAVVLIGRDGMARPLPGGRSVQFAPWTLQVLGAGSSRVLLVYGKPKGVPPGWYKVDTAFVRTVSLEAPPTLERRHVLTMDGIDVEAELAGFASLRLGDVVTRLQVLRMPIPGTEETELQVYFRDLTNDRGTYPAGRFVELAPLPDGRYRLDFNRARNPFCAYSSVYPCPVPWSGNSIPAAVEAGEKYHPARPGS